MDNAADPAADARLDRQLEKLDRLADLGLQIVEALAAQAKGSGPKVVDGDLALAYERVARAVRMAVMLPSRLIEDVRLAREKTVKAVPDPSDPAKARKDAVARIVKRVAEGDARLEPFQVGWARREARERLEHDDIYGQVMTQPISDLVQAICEDLGLTPHWARLAEEAWAQDEIDSGEVGEPLLELLDLEERAGRSGGEGVDEPPPDEAVTIPTFEERLQALARDPAILAAAGRPSG